jgi:Uma2 family endonuclease
VPPGAKVVAEPVVVFEILSPRTENEGLVVKNADHRATPSIQRYVILQQQQTGAMMFTRKGEDWVTELVTGDGAALQMPEIRVVIPLAELYADVEFPAAEDEPG